MGYKYWTHAEIAELKRFVSEGKNGYEIADTLGKTYNAINAKKKKLGLCHPLISKRQEWTDTEITLFKVLIRQGEKTDGEIATALGRTYLSVSMKKIKLGLCKPTPSFQLWSEWDLIKLRRYCKRGYPLVSIS